MFVPVFDPARIARGVKDCFFDRFHKNGSPQS